MNITSGSRLNIGNLLKVSREIIDDCTLENGGIVASNSTKGYFPDSAKNYLYIWPRDAAYTCLAANYLEIMDLQKFFFRWCLTRAEGFRKNGLFYEKYYPNGLKALMNFQPDQTGIVLLAVSDYLKKFPSEINDHEITELVTIAANGICSVWNGSCFTEVSNDLWEEKYCIPELEENFSYSLASCIKGLRCANEIIPTPTWLKVADEMKNRLDEHFEGYFIRSYGKMKDKRIDASIIGLVYPFEIYKADDPRIIASIKEIEKRLLANGGVHRYENDEYDGWIYDGKQMNKGAGAWPILNFWMSIYYSLKGDKLKAEEYFDWVIERMKERR
jgi:glucoamylase